MSTAGQRTAEARALAWGSLGQSVGAAAALLLFLRSGSDALMLDGLYSAVMAGATLIAGRVSRAAQQPRSRAYPFGAAGQEPLYVLFRTLVLLGCIAFALVSAAGKLLSHLQGEPLAAVRLDGLGWYFSAMVALNLWLWRLYTNAGCDVGHNGAMLQGMAMAARFDALLSAGTGVALLGSPLLAHTALAPLVPIADSLLVIMLSLVLLPEPMAVLMGAVAEAAGSSQTIATALQHSCCEAITPALQQQGCELHELAMIRLGRSVTAVAYVQPRTAMAAEQVDALRSQVHRRLTSALQATVLCEVIPTATHPYVQPFP